LCKLYFVGRIKKVDAFLYLLSLEEDNHTINNFRFCRMKVYSEDIGSISSEKITKLKYKLECYYYYS